MHGITLLKNRFKIEISELNEMSDSIWSTSLKNWIKMTEFLEGGWGRFS